MACQLTGEEFESIRNQFNEIDTNSDGKLTREEFKAFCLQQDESRSDAEIDYMMRIMDLDNSGTIEFPEFLEMLAFFEYNKDPYETQVRQMFKALDKDNDGFLSTEEIRQLWNIFTNNNYDLPSEEEIADIVKALDLNGDGKVDYNEFMERFDFDCM